jgi:predicted transcriptional regulator
VSEQSNGKPKPEPRKMRTVRVEDELWTEAQRVAAERGETLSDVIRDALARYVKRHG